MPRKLKPQKVSSYEHERSGETHDIFLDRNNLDFFAKAFGEEIRAPSEKECREKLERLCYQCESFEWRKIVVVETNEDRVMRRCSENSVTLNFEVYEISPKTGGGWVELEDVHDGTEYIRPYWGRLKTDAGAGVFVLPHLEELECALNDIRNRIAEMKKALGALLGEGAERVIAASLANSFAALPSPKHTETEAES